MSGYDLTRPCAGCPFGRGPDAVRGLHPRRLREIIYSDGGFVCHKTAHETGSGKPQECAGFLIYHLANETAPQMMRIAGRLGMFDADALLEHESECITEFRELRDAHTDRL